MESLKCKTFQGSVQAIEVWVWVLVGEVMSLYPLPVPPTLVCTLPALSGNVLKTRDAQRQGAFSQSWMCSVFSSQ